MWGSDLLTRESFAYIYKLCQYKKDEGETLSFNNFLSYNLRQLLRDRGLGRARGRHQGPSGYAQPCADPAPPGHSGVRAQAGRGPRHPPASAGMYGVQRRLRRRPDGGPCAAVG